MVEVFKTNITSKAEAALILANIHNQFPSYSANFDLQDCDRILRVKSTRERVKATSLIRLVINLGYHAEVLAEVGMPALIAERDLLNNKE
jgi:hypothetical protein